MDIVDKDAVGQGVLARQQGGTRRAADRDAGDGMGEVDALGGQPVEVRRPHLPVAGVSGVLRPPLIGEHIDDIGSLLEHGSLSHAGCLTAKRLTARE